MKTSSVALPSSKGFLGRLTVDWTFCDQPILIRLLCYRECCTVQRCIEVKDLSLGLVIVLQASVLCRRSPAVCRARPYLFAKLCLGSEPEACPKHTGHIDPASFYSTLVVPTAKTFIENMPLQNTRRDTAMMLDPFYTTPKTTQDCGECGWWASAHDQLPKDVKLDLFDAELLTRSLQNTGRTRSMSGSKRTSRSQTSSGMLMIYWKLKFRRHRLQAGLSSSKALSLG